jgi:hypothetical protein
MCILLRRKIPLLSGDTLEGGLKIAFVKTEEDVLGKKRGYYLKVQCKLNLKWSPRVSRYSTGVVTTSTNFNIFGVRGAVNLFAANWCVQTQLELQ